MRCLIVAGALQPLGAVHRTTVTRIEGQPRCDQAAHLLGRWAAAHQQAVSPAPRRWYELFLAYARACSHICPGRSVPQPAPAGYRPGRWPWNAEDERKFITASRLPSPSIGGGAGGGGLSWYTTFVAS